MLCGRGLFFGRNSGFNQFAGRVRKWILCLQKFLFEGTLAKGFKADCSHIDARLFSQFDKATKGIGELFDINLLRDLLFEKGFGFADELLDIFVGEGFYKIAVDKLFILCILFSQGKEFQKRHWADFFFEAAFFACMRH